MPPEQPNEIQASGDCVAEKRHGFESSLSEDEQRVLAMMLRFGATDALHASEGEGQGAVTLVLKGPSDSRSFFPGYLTGPASPVLPRGAESDPLCRMQIRLG